MWRIVIILTCNQLCVLPNTYTVSCQKAQWKIKTLRLENQSNLTWLLPNYSPPFLANGCHSQVLRSQSLRQVVTTISSLASSFLLPFIPWLCQINSHLPKFQWGLMEIVQDARLGLYQKCLLSISKSNIFKDSLQRVQDQEDFVEERHCWQSL